MFKVFSKIIKNSKITEEDLKEIQPFIFHNYLAADRLGLQVANILNYYPLMPISAQVDLTQAILQKSVPFIKYIKKPKEDKNLQSTLIMLQRHYSCNQQVALQYYDILTGEDILDLQEYYDVGGLKGKK